MMVPRTGRRVEMLPRTAGHDQQHRLPNDPPQLGFPSLQRRALLGPELVLVVDGVGDAVGAFDVVEQPGPDVLRDAEAGGVRS